jgi:hypothetical protein
VTFNILALALGWLLARTVRVVPLGVPNSGAAAPPSPTPSPTPPRRRHPQPVPRGSTVPVSTTTSVPWPQVVPAGLPAFPSSAWVPDAPPPAPVVDRASQLLKQLWSGGAGTFKTEKTAGRWITYRATDMGNGKRGVVAYRLAALHAVPSAPATPAASSSSSPTQLATMSTSPVALPVLRRGARGESVKVLQRRLNITDDGAFGPGTEAAVKNFQATHGLRVDGVVGNETWTSLLGRSAA